VLYQLAAGSARSYSIFTPVIPRRPPINHLPSQQLPNYENAKSYGPTFLAPARYLPQHFDIFPWSQ
jgi:hypothetical protein